MNVLGKVKRFAEKTAVKAQCALTRKHDGFDGLIVAIALVVISLILIGLFKDEIMTAVQTVISSIATKISELLNFT